MYKYVSKDDLEAIANVDVTPEIMGLKIEHVYYMLCSSTVLIIFTNVFFLLFSLMCLGIFFRYLTELEKKGEPLFFQRNLREKLKKIEKFVPVAHGIEHERRDYL